MILAGRVKPDADVLLSTGCVAILSVSQGQAQSLAQMLRAAPVSTERARICLQFCGQFQKTAGYFAFGCY